MDHHLAQFNVARLRAPLDSPVLAGFVDQLEAVNAIGDASPGFVWRLQTDAGDATAVRVFDDDSIIVNLTVWESIDQFTDFVYRSDHKDVLRQRREWFVPMEEAYFVLWWVPAGHIPSVEEAEARLVQLREHGPTPEAFTVRDRFPAPAEDEPAPELLD